jgi:hypothetical protein
MATYDYITLGGLKCDVESYQPNRPLDNRSVRETLNNHTRVSVGTARGRTWDVTLLFRYDDPAAGYADYADVDGWLATTDDAGLILAFVGLLGESCNVTIESADAAAPKSTLIGWWTRPIKLREVLP